MIYCLNPIIFLVKSNFLNPFSILFLDRSPFLVTETLARRLRTILQSHGDAPQPGQARGLVHHAHGAPAALLGTQEGIAMGDLSSKTLP